MIVRKAKKQDASTLLDLIAAKAEFDRSMKGFDGDISTTVAKIERTLFGDLPFAHALLLESQGYVVGFALYHYRYSSFTGEPSIWLDDLLVIGEQRSQGYGAELMHSLKQQAQCALASHIAWTASPHNTRAHAFYTRMAPK
ncbi:histone acetyltransferase HPA2 and related acetyltransferases [Vibrio ponticus]|nr:histone acetyltransferase HPA2 and related acetyltransferases [Vibrio ponticus]